MEILDPSVLILMLMVEEMLVFLLMEILLNVMDSLLEISPSNLHLDAYLKNIVGLGISRNE